MASNKQSSPTFRATRVPLILVGQRSPKKGDTDGQVLCHYRGGARDYIIKKHKKIYPKCK